MIEIRNFSKRDIYKNYNLKIGAGITFIKGRNGSGKTTLLDCIAGLDRDYKGSITGNTNTVYLNQNLYFSGRLKSKDMVKFIYQLEGIRNGQEYYCNKMNKYNDTMDFDKLLEKRIGILSGGELKLLFFSVVSSLEKEVYIFDEPYASVDAAGKAIINSILKGLQEAGKTIIITSHEEGFFNSLEKINVVELD